MNTLEYYDTRAEELRLRLLERDMESAERQFLATQAALAEHAVVAYVRNLPVEPASYPAIEYLRLAQRVGCSPEEAFRKASEGVRVFTGRDGSLIRFHPDDHEFIHWSMPAHDTGRPVRKGCGFIRSSRGSVVYTACPDDAEHYCKGKRRHCWSLHCPDCMNDTALKKGVQVELQLLMYRRLMEKQSRNVGDIGHWVVSPPQELAKSLIQTKDEFDALCRYVDSTMQSHGALAGITVFHPWRQQDDSWRLSPHFHILCYGRIDTTAFRRENPGWIIKKVHARERIRSIRHTVAYLMTHMGLATVERDPDSVDWDLDVLDRMIPGIKSPGADYTEKDWDDYGSGRGRMAGSLAGIDWTEWTMDRLWTDTRIRYWGGVARNKIRIIGIHRRYRIRVCRDCGRVLRTYEGSEDACGSYVRYIQDSPVMALSENFSIVSTTFLRYKDDLRAEGMSITDYASLIPFAASALDLGLPDSKDFVMAGPFEEPDEYFLRRQAAALGPTCRSPCAIPDFERCGRYVLCSRSRIGRWDAASRRGASVIHRPRILPIPLDSIKEYFFRF